MISYELNSKILKLAPKHSVSDIAPSTFADLKGSNLVVWSGASDLTIYGDASVNWAMRAWHDSLHIALDADFSLLGESRVAFEQARLIGGGYGDLIIAEVLGQVEYYNRFGCFPIDQVAFVKQYLERM